jgi:hypothetical protein
MQENQATRGAPSESATCPTEDAEHHAESATADSVETTSLARSKGGTVLCTGDRRDARGSS